MKLSTPTTIVLVALAIPSSVYGDVITINATDRGWYGFEGTHFPENTGYSVGNSGGVGGGEIRNWFIFDLASITQTILSAELQLDNSAYASPDPFEIYELHDIATNLDDLVGGFGGVSAFNDFGSGAIFGAYTATLADTFQTIIVPMSTDALISINGSSGGFWAVGGVITTLGNDPFITEGIFGLTGDFPLSSTRLVITTIPGAPALPLLITIPLFLRSRRRFSFQPHSED